MDQQFKYKTECGRQDEFSLFYKKIYPTHSISDYDTACYINSIKTFRETKGHHIINDEDYDDSMFEGLTNEQYADKYPLHYDDFGHVSNFKKYNE